jgi:hypothetical protein
MIVQGCIVGILITIGTRRNDVIQVRNVEVKNHEKKREENVSSSASANCFFERLICLMSVTSCGIKLIKATLTLYQIAFRGDVKNT